ncbi:MAG: penicillin acylase family protein [Anaerolineae bacterium]|nr:penicillin acylase family protein [Anaerolineae bacterium]
MSCLRRLVVLLVIVALLVGVLAGALLYTSRKMIPQVDGALRLAGLRDEVTILRDAAGVPHIYARNAADLFFAQGVVQAQDRWWQMEFNRHTGLGRISELVGDNEEALNNDIFIRTVGWNRAAQADLDAISDETRAALDAFSAGVNAYIMGKSGGDLAVEYSLLGVTGVNIPVEPWQPLHSLAWAQVMAWGLSDNLNSELDRLNFASEYGQDNAEAMLPYLMPSYPDDHPTILSADDLPVEPAPVSTTQRAPGDSGDLAYLAGVQARLMGTPPEMGKDFGLGSNNWVVSGDLTTTGQPILANDPHLGVQMPSIWYQTGLHCIEVNAECPYDVVGFSFPGAPGVIVGRNTHIAWGVTNATVDTQDLYVIDVDPENDIRYRVDGEWQDMQVINETIRVGGGADHTVRVRITRFGPIITDSSFYEWSGEAVGKPLALRWAAISEPGDLLGAVLGLNRAVDWESFRRALTLWQWPAQNFVYADAQGNIGYQLPGLHPIRAAGQAGLWPVDGSTSANDWRGFIPFENLPRIFNPARGYIVTANNKIVPDEYYTQLAARLGDQFGADATFTFGVDVDRGYRAARITQLIEAAAADRISVDVMRAIQADNYDLTAPALLPPALALDYGPDVPAEAVAWMGEWDYQMGMDSGQAALYAAYWANLARRLWNDELGFTMGGSPVSLGAVALVNEPDSAYWDDMSTADRVETRDDVLRAAFVDAFNELKGRLGENYRMWRWGDIHTTTFVSNPLGLSGIGPIEGYVNAGPVRTGGSSETINRSAWDVSAPYEVGSLSSMRMIVDLSDPDGGLWIHTTGQSGHPASLYYREMIDRWRNVQYDRMRFTRDAVEASAANRLTLQPE